MKVSGNRSETDEQLLKMFILDVLRHDVVEQIPSILKLLNNRSSLGWRGFWPHDFNADEVVPALKELIRDGAINACAEDESGELQPLIPEQVEAEQDEGRLWFGITEKGRKLWNQWEPPTLEDPVEHPPSQG